MICTHPQTSISKYEIAGLAIVGAGILIFATPGIPDEAIPLGAGGFKSFQALKNALGSAGPGQAWHHIVEQTPGNVAKFGSGVIQNISNVIQLPHGPETIHNQISGFYSSIQPWITGSSSMTVRQWLSTQSFEAQRLFGIQMIEMFGVRSIFNILSKKTTYGVCTDS
jgi:hypothetical protein